MRYLRLVSIMFLAMALLLPGGCKKKMVTVRTGEIVLCTEGEIVSDTTEEIEVPAEEVGEYSVVTKVETCDLHAKLAKLYAEAQAAIRGGDLEAARSSLTEILKLDAAYRKAKTQLADIEAGKTPGADSPSTGQPADPGQDPGTPGEEDPAGPILTLASFTPDSVAGLVGQGLIADPFTLTRDYLPATPGTLLKAVIVAEQFKDATAAKRELDRVIKPSYPTGSSQTTTAGRSVYYGVNGKVSAAAFVDGAVLVVVEGAATGASGSSIKAKVLEVAGAIGK